MVLRRNKKRRVLATHSILIHSIFMSVMVALSLWVIGYGAAMGLHLEAAQELIRDHLIPPEMLASGETVVLVLLDDNTAALQALIFEVAVFLAAVSILWLMVAGLYRPTGPAQARRLLIVWLAGLALVGFGAGLIGFFRLHGNPDFRSVAIPHLSVIFGLSSMLLYWLVGSLLVTPRINRPAVPLSARLI